MIGRNVSALVAAQVATKAINLLVSVALVRWLGVHELGRYAYVLAFCFPFGALADFGLATLAIRDASRAPAQTPRVIAVVRRAALTLAVASSAAMVAWRCSSATTPPSSPPSASAGSRRSSPRAPCPRSCS